MKAHLLYPDQDFDFDREPPAHADDLVQDLELNTTLRAMAAGDDFLLQVSAKVLLAGLTDAGSIRYRQDILADCIAEPGIVRQMYAIAIGALEDKRGLWGFFVSRNPTSILATAISQLEVLIPRLRELRQVADDHAGRFSSRGLVTLMHSLQRELDDDYFATLSTHLKDLRFRNGELISAELDRDNRGINYVLRSGDTRRGWRQRVGIEPRSGYSFTIPPRDEAGFQALQDIVDRGLNLVANAAAQSADHVASFFTMLRAELGFYIAALNLREQMTSRDQPITFPVPAPADSLEFTCTDLRDAALALLGEQVVGNDVDADGKPLVIITGANSGGKSTFLRSAGQAQLMMQAGLFVTARFYRAAICRQTFTHFVREEDPDMISGRLDEELRRMSSVVDQLSAHSLVLFNESFAATNEREGSEICRQVVRALLEAGTRVFFVTHHFDFADSLRHGDPGTALFLRAPRERTFKLVPADPLPTSFGQDDYHRIGGWLAEGSAAG